VLDPGLQGPGLQEACRAGDDEPVRAISRPTPVPDRDVHSPPLVAASSRCGQASRARPGNRLQVAVIGGGAAALTTAWLLDGCHAVTLFERQEQLGGHADTVYVRIDDELMHVEAGFEFFSDVMFPSFNRLLRCLDVGVRKFPLSLTVYRGDHSRMYRLPPVRGRHVLWSELAPGKLSHLLQFRHVLERSRRIVEECDTTPTVAEFLARVRLSRSFTDGFLYPLLMGGWGIEREELERLAAYNVFKYFLLQRPSGLAPFFWNEVVGGTRTYVDAMTRELKQTTVTLGADITRLARADGKWLVEDRGTVHRFDQVVVATDARSATQMLAGVDEVGALSGELSDIRYAETRIAVHGDRRLMPRNPRDWSVLNVRFDAPTSAATIWKVWTGRSVFRSWVTHEPDLPAPLYALRTYQHVLPDPSYFRAQRVLAARQGTSGLWLAGVYMHDVDSHESAITSAVAVARRLASDSPNLRRLTSEEAERSVPAPAPARGMAPS